MNNPTEKVETLSPFKKCCMTIGAIPTSYMESLSYYEALTCFYNFLDKEVIPTLNNNADAVTELQNLYIELKNYVDNYFTNLDVQEEINNKLDEMVTTGQLQEIISEYLNSKALFGFDNVEDMKQGTNLINGSYAKTLGFYQKNDGGGATYKIRTITNEDIIDNCFIININRDNLIAELIYDTINVKQIGAYGNNVNDDTSILQKAFLKEQCKIYFPSGTYLINNNLILQNQVEVTGDGDSSIIKWNSEVNEYCIKIPISSKYCKINNIVIDGNLKGNGIYDGMDKTGYDNNRTCVESIKLFKCVIGITMNATGSEFYNIYCFGDLQNQTLGGNSLIGFNILSTDNKISNCRVQCFSEYGIYCNASSNQLVNVKTSVNGNGIYFSGANYNCIIESQENYKDNVIMNNVIESIFTINSNGAGCVQKSSEEIPNELNEYSCFNLINCKDLTINGTSITRCTYSGTYSCEGYAIKMDYRCINCNLNLIYYTNTPSINNPLIINKDFKNLLFNNIKINNKMLTSNYKETELTNFYSTSIANVEIVNDTIISTITQDTIVSNPIVKNNQLTSPNLALSFNVDLNEMFTINNRSINVYGIKTSGTTGIMSKINYQIRSYNFENMKHVLIFINAKENEDLSEYQRFQFTLNVVNPLPTTGETITLTDVKFYTTN